jgi:hypothetical protein
MTQLCNVAGTQSTEIRWEVQIEWDVEEIWRVTPEGADMLKLELGKWGESEMTELYHEEIRSLSYYLSLKIEPYLKGLVAPYPAVHQPSHILSSIQLKSHPSIHPSISSIFKNAQRQLRPNL